MPIVVFDIDGVLADHRHRLHFVANPDGSKKKNPDWGSFSAHCSLDQPVPLGKQLYEMLSKDHDIAFVSGRLNSMREITVGWLLEHIVGGRSFQLFTRPDDSVVRTRYWKLSIVRMLDRSASGPVILVIDDTPAIIDTLLAAGYAVLPFSDRRDKLLEEESFIKKHTDLYCAECRRGLWEIENLLYCPVCEKDWIAAKIGG